MKFFALTALLISVLCVSCNKQNETAAPGGGKSSGVIKTDTRNIVGFKKIKAENAIELNVSVSGGYSLVLKADDDVLANVTTELDGDTLVISLKGKNNIKSKVNVSITMPTLEGLELNGATTATVTGVKSDELKVEANGASKANISGEAAKVKIKAIGASVVDTENVKAEKAEVEAVGASTIKVAASAELKAKSVGASTVTYTGDPKSLEQNATDVSTISKK